MSNVSAFAIFILVLSPLLIPLTITGVHAIADWRRSLRTALRNTDPKSYAGQS
jgi:hypothetical protein